MQQFSLDLEIVKKPLIFLEYFCTMHSHKYKENMSKIAFLARKVLFSCAIPHHLQTSCRENMFWQNYDTALNTLFTNVYSYSFSFWFRKPCEKSLFFFGTIRGHREWCRSLYLFSFLTYLALREDRSWPLFVVKCLIYALIG